MVEIKNPTTQLFKIYQLVYIKGLTGIIVTRKVMLERKDSFFDAPEIQQCILLPCLSSVLIFNSPTFVAER